MMKGVQWEWLKSTVTLLEEGVERAGLSDFYVFAYA